MRATSARFSIPLALPLLLYLLSAAIGAWLAYTPQQSIADLIFILLGVGLYAVIVGLRGADGMLTALVLGLLLASALLVGVFVLTFDFSAAKFGILSQIGTALQSGGALPLPPLHPNHLAGMLELTLPLGVALGAELFFRRAWGGFGLVIGLCVVIGLGLLLSGSRGAWAALALVGLVCFGVFAGRAIWKRHRRLLKPAAFILIFSAVILALVMQDRVSFFSSLSSGLAGANGTEIPRPELYRQVWRLVQDYLFTGSGLGTFPMVYSTYALQQNVFILPHAHNIFLQVWLEQGLLGLLAVIWLILGFYRWMWLRRTRWTWLAVGGLAATTIMLLHGLADAALWYGDVTRALFLLPLAFAIAGTRPDSQPVREPRAYIAIGAASLVLVAGLSSGQLLPLWYANLGSLAQTRVELGQYTFPKTLVEYVRRGSDLSTAESFFDRALQLDPENVTANQRLGAIALAQGDYDRALAYSLMAARRAPDNLVTRQLLGDAYLALGQSDRAFAYWSHIAGARDMLNIEAAVRFERNGDVERAAWARQLAERIQTN